MKVKNDNLFRLDRPKGLPFIFALKGVFPMNILFKH